MLIRVEGEVYAPGIYQIKSGAEGTALDGTNYSDW